MLLAAARAAENEGDNWVASEDVFIDDDNYEAANYAYIQAGIAFIVTPGRWVLSAHHIVRALRMGLAKA